MFYSDDVGMVCELLKSEWSLGINKTPHFYYKQDGMGRKNVPSSIYVYSTGRNNTKQGIGYDSFRRTARVAIDIQTPQSRALHYEMCNEVYRILLKYRMAGKEALGGWDYIEIPTDSFKGGYTAYYQDVFDISLVSEVTPLPAPNK